MPKIKVLLADDHGVLRGGVGALLERQGEFVVVAEANTAEEAIVRARETHPDVAVVDVRMPGGGIEATRQLKREFPTLAVLMLSQYRDPAYLRRALEAGASGYTLKQAGSEELVEAVRAVARGESYLHPSLTSALVDQMRGISTNSPSSTEEALSDRESEVLHRVALGYTTAEIAHQLYLSVRTVETYKTRGLEKLNLNGRAALVRYAIEQGWLNDDAGETVP
jgi:two-component system, NarL family, response regulator NreC